jgi:hypothetical protein
LSSEVDGREIRYVLLVSAALALVTAMPYALGVVVSSPEMEFSGFVIGLEDGYSYLCNMLQGYQGDWLYHLYYTPEPHQGELLFLFYLLLGKLARWTGMSLIVTFHLSRLLLIPVALYAFYQLAVYFSFRPAVRRLAVLLFAFGGGLGWLWALLGLSTELGQMPVDLWVPDASFFLSTLTYPHLILGQAFLFWFILFTLRYMDGGEWRSALWAALTGLCSSLIHPYTLPVIGVPLGIYALWRAWCNRRVSWWRPILRLVIVFLPSMPYLVYTWRVFQTNFAFVAWQEQNLLYSPAPHLYLLGLGIPLALAVLGLITGEGETSRHPFLAIWVLVVLPLLYIPYPIQRRFLDGYQAPVAMLGAGGLYFLLQLLPRPGWRVLVTIAVCFSIVLSNVFLLLGSVAISVTPDDPVYRAGWEMSAARWFWGDPTYPVVLTSYATGNLLPGHVPVRSFVGHGSQTVDSAGKVRLVEEFFGTGRDDTWRRELLAQYGVDYVYHGPREKALGGFNPGRAAYLQLSYDNGAVQIYRVGAGE